MLQSNCVTFFPAQYFSSRNLLSEALHVNFNLDSPSNIRIKVNRAFVCIVYTELVLIGQTIVDKRVHSPILIRRNSNKPFSNKIMQRLEFLGSFSYRFCFMTSLFEIQAHSSGTK